MELKDIVASANESGISAAEVLDAIAVALDEMRKALAEDPDPAEDPEAKLSLEQGFDQVL